MNYIIKPSWFYWLSVVDAVRIACIGCIIITGVATMILLFARGDCYEGDDEYKAITKWIESCIVLMAICVLIVIFVPSKQTLIEMQIAKYATYENAQWTVEGLKSAVDYVIKALERLK